MGPQELRSGLCPEIRQPRQCALQVSTDDNDLIMSDVTRHQCRPGLSPCMRYLATGAEDGHVYIYDTRHVTSWLQRLDTCGPEVITDVAFSPSGGQLVAASLEGIISSFSI